MTLMRLGLSLFIFVQSYIVFVISLSGPSQKCVYNKYQRSWFSSSLHTVRGIPTSSNHGALFTSMGGDNHPENSAQTEQHASKLILSRGNFLKLASATAATVLCGTALPEPSAASTNMFVSSNLKKTQQNTLEESISGFVAGGAVSTAKTLVKYPLDTATVRLQLPGTPYSLRNPLILFDDTFRGILSPLLANIPAGALFFAIKDTTKSVLKNNFDDLPKWVSTSIAVGVAQIPYWIVRNPSEVVKTRQQGGIEGYNKGVNAIDAYKLVYKDARMSAGGDESLVSTIRRGFYSGYWENIIYAYPADVIKFVCYEGLTKGKKDISPLEGAIFGSASTAVAQLLTTPLDVVRNRVMASNGANVTNDDGDQIPKPVDKDSYVGSLVRLGREEGLKGLFAGAALRFGKALLSGAIQFATYEETKSSISKLFEGKRT